MADKTYRPEKAHATQIEALKELQESNSVHKNAKLILLGSARNQDDLKRVETLKALAKSLGVEVSQQITSQKISNSFLVQRTIHC